MRRGGSSRRHSGGLGAVTATWRAVARLIVVESGISAGSSWLSKSQPGEWRSE
jgi:hypothetical protein